MVERNISVLCCLVLSCPVLAVLYCVVLSCLRQSKRTLAFRHGSTRGPTTAQENTPKALFHAPHFRRVELFLLLALNGSGARGEAAGKLKDLSTNNSTNKKRMFGFLEPEASVILSFFHFSSFSAPQAKKIFGPTFPTLSLIPGINNSGGGNDFQNLHFCFNSRN